MQTLGALSFFAFADPLRLGFRHWTLIRLKVAAAHLTAVADRVARLPETFFVGITTGDYNVFVGGISRSNDDLMAFLSKGLFKVAGVAKTSTSSILELTKRRGPLVEEIDGEKNRKRLRPSNTALAKGEDQDIDPIDIDIIDQLQRDGRKSYSQIAIALRLSEATVHKRVARLKDSGVVSFVAFANPLSLGLHQWTMFEVVVQPQRINAIASALAAFPEIVFVGLTTGEYDIFATGIFKSDEDVLTFLTERLGSISGISAISTTDVLRVVKRELVFPIRSRLGIT